MMESKKKKRTKKQKQKYIYIYVLKSSSLLRLFHISSIRARTKAKVRWRRTVGGVGRPSVRTYDDGNHSYRLDRQTDRLANKWTDGWGGGGGGLLHPPSFPLTSLQSSSSSSLLRSVFGLVAVQFRSCGASSSRSSFWFYLLVLLFGFCSVFLLFIYLVHTFFPRRPSLLSSAPRQLRLLLLPPPAPPPRPYTALLAL